MINFLYVCVHEHVNTHVVAILHVYGVNTGER